MPFALVVMLMTGLAVLAAMPAGLARAQPAPGERPPRVGLVLSGGAAKGLAHVGVLAVLEEAGVQADVVTGTSMGAVVGGLYAAGYTPAQLGAIARERDWAALFAGRPKRRALVLEDRLTDRGAQVTLPVEGGTVRLPSGLLSGQDVFELLARLTWPVHDVRDFRRLPRAFAAVAVELETGEAVRLDTGYLPRAMRASLSLPSVFTPVEIDGRRLLDGGVVRNLPAEDAQALGADVLVCVDVSDETEDDRPPSFLDVMTEAAFYANTRSAEAQRARCHVIIEPEVEGLSAFAFDQADAWIERGRAAARRALPELRALADSLGPRPAAPRARSLDPEPRRVVAIDVRGVSEAAEALVRERLDLALPATLTPDQVEAALARVYVLDNFRTVSYRVQPAEDERGHVLVVAPEAVTADRLRAGLRYDTDNKAALYASLSLRHLLRYGSTTELSLRLGEETQLEAGYRARVQTDRVLGLDAAAVVGGRVRFTRLPVRLDLDGRRATSDLAADLDVIRGQVLIGRGVEERVFVGTFLSVEHARAEPDVGPDTTGTYATTFTSLTTVVLADTRDRVGFPSRGLRLNARGEVATGALGGPRFQHLSLDTEVLLPVAVGVSLYGRSVLTRGYGTDLPQHYATFLGGVVVLPLLPGRLFPLYGTEAQGRVGRAAQLAVAGVQWARPGDRFVRLSAHAGRAGSDWTLDPDAFATGLGLTVGARTLLGPVRLTLSNDTFGGMPDLTFSAGYVF